VPLRYLRPTERWEEGAVVMDKITGKSRGFAFVTFKDILGAHRALKEPSKKVLVSTSQCL